MINICLVNISFLNRLFIRISFLKRLFRRATQFFVNGLFKRFCKKSVLTLSLLLYLSPSAVAGEQTLIYAPATPSSILLILAAESLPDIEVKIFTNHSQAYALFLNKKVQILSTGLSVGVRLFRQGVPVRIVNSYVSGMTYLVTACNISQNSDRREARVDGNVRMEIRDLSDLKGKTLYMPFTGSPIEEVTQFFAASEGLLWKRDITIAYAMFPEAVSMLRMGKISCAVLPEPFVSMVEMDREPEPYGGKVRDIDSISSGVGNCKKIDIALSYKKLWERYTGDHDGYPQVATFVNRKWALSHGPMIDKLNGALAEAIIYVADNPEQAVKKGASCMGFSEDILKRSLGRTDFNLLQGGGLKEAIRNYYQTIGAPLDETFENFF